MLLAAGVGDDDVETAKAGDGFSYKVDAELLLAEVAGDGDGLAPFSFDEGDDLLRVGFFGGKGS